MAATEAEAPPADWRHERTFAVLSLGAIALFTAFVLGFGALTLASYFALARSYLAISLLILFAAIICFSGQALIGIRQSGNYRERPLAGIGAAFAGKWREDRGLSLLWPLIGFAMLMPSFTAFKQRILPSAGFVHDPALASIDRAIFGTDPGLWLHEAIGSAATTAFFDAVYHGWFVPTTLGVVVVGLCAGVRTRAQYMIAYFGVWILLGAAAAYSLPAAGPAFYEALVSPVGAEPFRAVHEQLVATGSSAGFLTSLYNQHYLLTNLNHPDLVVGGGISAIPSVHNALAVLFALASFRIHRVCGAAMSAFALLIWIASVYLNWHYAIDGIVGGAGAALLWFSAGMFVDRVIALPRRAGQLRAGPHPAWLPNLPSS